MLKHEKDVFEKVDALIGAIKTSDIYRNYLAQNSKVESDPELKRRIDDFRRENFEIQQNYQGDELDKKMDDFEMRYASFRRNPLVEQFLAAELAFCRLIQEIENKVESELDFN